MPVRVIEAVQLWRRRLFESVHDLCAACREPLEPLGFQGICAFCHDDLDAGNPARPASLPGSPDLDGLAALGIYEGALRQAVHRVKYRSERRLGLALGYMMGALAAELPEVRRVDAIIPMPLHPERAWHRGYNHADPLADGIARVIGRPCERGLLLRVRATKQQASLGDDERRANVRGAFAVASGAPGAARPEAPGTSSGSVRSILAARSSGTAAAGRRFLLVDDVVTTGATMGAAAAALKAAGALRVYGLALASAPRRDRPREGLTGGEGESGR